MAAEWVRLAVRQAPLEVTVGADRPCVEARTRMTRVEADRAYEVVAKVTEAVADQLARAAVMAELAAVAVVERSHRVGVMAVSDCTGTEEVMRAI